MFLYCKILQNPKNRQILYSTVRFFFNVLQHILCGFLSTDEPMYFSQIKFMDLREGLVSQDQKVFLVGSFLCFVCSSQDTVACTGEH